MMPICPQCHSPRIATRDHARKAGGTIGAIAGAATSLVAGLKGIRLGGLLSGSSHLIAGPVGMTLGVVASAILGTLAGAAAGCSTGSALGELIDDKILDNYCCQDCGHTFGSFSNPPYSGARQPPGNSDEDLFEDQGYPSFHTD